MLRNISNVHFFSMIIIVTGIYYGFVLAKYARYFRGQLKKRLGKGSDNPKPT
jgi:hypothetical protein